MKNKLYSGTTKTIYSTVNDGVVILAFNDTIPRVNKISKPYQSMNIQNNVHSIDNEIIHKASNVNSRTRIDDDKKEIKSIEGKGVINNALSAFIMERLDMVGVHTHFIKKLNLFEQQVYLVDVIPLQVRVTTLACERYVHELNIEQGLVFDRPIMDFRLKNDKLNYPPVNETQILHFQWLNKNELYKLKREALAVSNFLSGLFAAIDIRLVECRLEFGVMFDGMDIQIVLIDEISLDNCKLWDIATNKKFGLDLISDYNNGIENNHNDILESYKEVVKRLNIMQF